MIKHKIKQLVDLRKLGIDKAAKLLEAFKPRLKSSACVSVQLCIAAINLCRRKGLLPLKYKGYAISWTLQNPYITLVPKLGVSVRV